jgi:hypothetical protein
MASNDSPNLMASNDSLNPTTSHEVVTSDNDVIIEAENGPDLETAKFKRRCLNYHKEAIELFKFNIDLKSKMEDDWRKKIDELDRERQNLLKIVHNDLVLRVTDNVKAMSPNPEFLEV